MRTNSKRRDVTHPRVGSVLNDFDILFELLQTEQLVVIWRAFARRNRHPVIIRVKIRHATFLEESNGLLTDEPHAKEPTYVSQTQRNRNPPWKAALIISRRRIVVHLPRLGKS